MKTVALLLVPLFLAATGFAQTIYVCDYHLLDKEGNPSAYYRAFLVRYDDGTGFARVRFEDSRGDTNAVADMDLREDIATLKSEVKGGADTTYMMLVGSKPQLVRGKINDDYVPETFGFYQDKDGYYVPWTVAKGNLEDDNSKVIIGDYDNVNLVEQNELTEDLVLEFFNKDEDFYTGLFATTVRPLTPDQMGTTLHLLVVANTEDEEIGKTCEQDQTRTVKNFKDLSGFLGIGFNPVVISGEKYSKQAVEDAINNLRPNKKDIVIFYYTGHGFGNLNDNYKYPHLVLRTANYQPLEPNSLAMEDIYQRIVAKGARVNLEMSDCCNADPNQLAPSMPEVTRTRSSGLGWDKNTAVSLFLPPKPISILMTAADKGELAASNLSFGGFFSYNFKAALDRYLSPFNGMTGVTWDMILKEAKTQTAAKANNTICDIPTIGSRRCVQNPIYSIR